MQKRHACIIIILVVQWACVASLLTANAERDLIYSQYLKTDNATTTVTDMTTTTAHATTTADKFVCTKEELEKCKICTKGHFSNNRQCIII